jgi:hypothetical protein
MAYVTGRRKGAWELRESRATPAGPRSRTLATFRTLTPDVVARAQARASAPLDADEVRRAALRAGAPVVVPGPDHAARELLAHLAAGRRPRPVLGRLVLDALADRQGGVSDNARAASAWAAASAEQRAQALGDLLLLADRLPRRRRNLGSGFPRISSAPG